MINFQRCKSIHPQKRKMKMRLLNFQVVILIRIIRIKTMKKSRKKRKNKIQLLLKNNKKRTQAAAIMIYLVIMTTMIKNHPAAKKEYKYKAKNKFQKQGNQTAKSKEIKIKNKKCYMIT